MLTFKLRADVTVAAITTVRADTLEQAIEIARTRGVTLHEFEGMDNDSTEWVIYMADGEPTNIRETD